MFELLHPLKMSSKTKKRRSLEMEPAKSLPSTPKKSRKFSDKENARKGSSSKKRSEYDSGFPSSSSSLNDSTRKKKTPEKTRKRKVDKAKSEDSKQTQDVNMLDVAQLLALGEDKEDHNEGMTVDSGGSASDSSMSDWEEVSEKIEVREPVIPKEGVNITLEVPNMHMKRKKRGIDLEAHIKRQLNRVKREMQVLMHKVHVLGWIAHMMFVNNILNSQLLMGQSLSLVTTNNLYPPKLSDLGYLERIVKWFYKTIELKENTKDPKCPNGLADELCYQFNNKVAFSKKYLVLMFIVMLRTLGLKARIVMSLQVVPIRPLSSELTDTKVKVETEEKAEVKEVKVKAEIESNYFAKNEGSANTSKQPAKQGKRIAKNMAETEEKAEVKEVKIKAEVESNYFMKKESSASTTKQPAKQGKRSAKDQTKNEVTSDSKQAKTKTTKPKVGRKQQSDKKSPEVNPSTSTSDMSTPKRSVKRIKHESSEEDNISRHFKVSSVTKAKAKPKGRISKKVPECSQYFSGSESKVTSTQNATKRKTKTSAEIKTPKNVKLLKKKTTGDDSSDTDSEFTPMSLNKKNVKKEIDRRVLSSDEEAKTVKKRQGVDVWTEVFLESEEKWISVDVPRQKIHCINELHSKATQPVVYILACNNDSSIKDVTKRYVPNWHSDTKKRRVDDAWWEHTMWRYMPLKTAQDREEDEDIDRQLRDKPLPTSIGEYKDHPLYALKRHLLKFEGIYPSEAPTLGFVRGEPVYARECVVTLKSRDIWFKDARVVRLKEEPYKIVKSRPKYDKMTGEFKKDLPLELFGFWQTEDYIPPIAVDGKVPRNEYGNVDLFKPCMLPGGTVHLQIPALNRVAKKLGIDCAPAIVGFEFHSGGCHPVHDGFVVCEEFKEQILDAWNKEIDESAKRNEEKREKRIYGNWRRLIRGLLIREKLKIKYCFGENSDEEEIQSSQASPVKPSTSRNKNR